MTSFFGASPTNSMIHIFDTLHLGRPGIIAVTALVYPLMRFFSKRELEL